MPLPGAGLSGGCLPREAAGGTAPVAGQLWKPGFSSGRNSVCRAWRLRGGAADLLSSGQERPRCPGPSRPLPVPGGGRILGCVPAPCAPGLRCWIRAPGPRSPLRGAAAPAPPSCSWSRRVPPCALQPLGSSAHSPGRAVAVTVPGSPRASSPSRVLLHLPGASFRLGRSVQLLLLRDGALLSWGHSPRPQPGSSRAPPPWRPLFLYFFFPVFLP